MTVIVGVLCQDGLVIGTDSSATFGTGQIKTIEQRTDKLTIIADSVIVAGTGQVGMNQRFCRIVEQFHENKSFKGHHIDVGRALCTNARNDFASTQAQRDTYAALVGFSLNNTPYLVEFPASDFQPEFKDRKIWYCSMGSGQIIADPFLALMRQVFWKDGPPTVSAATFAVTWTLDLAVEFNAGGVNGPVRIAVLERGQKGKLEGRVLEDDELLEHRDNIAQAVELLRGLKRDQTPTAETPEPPSAAPAQTEP